MVNMDDGFALRDSTVGIFGLGLMGGSLAMSLKGHCAHLIGFDSHPATLELALSKKIIDQGNLALGGATDETKHIDLLILATPIPAIINTIQQLPSFISHPCIVMDLGSTKGDILRAMSALPKHFDPIGTHPICGKEKLGLENADAELFRNAPFAITPLERTTEKARSAVQQIISVLGANLIEITADDHDRILASTSHLPYLISSALAHATPQEFTSLIGTGFRSTSRLARTPSYMMMGVLQSNRKNILHSIQLFRASLSKMESALQQEEYSELEILLNQSRDSYLLLSGNH